MLMPKRVKHRKQHRGRMEGKATRGNFIDFGDYGIMATECGWITARQIEAGRIAMTRHIKRGGKVWIRIFPDKPYTKKPLEQRMGKGKAPVEGWVAVIKPGRILYEMNGVPVEIAKEAMRLAIYKMPIRCKFVTKDDFKNGAPLEQGQAHSIERAERKYSGAPATGQAPAAAVEESELPVAGDEVEVPIVEATNEETAEAPAEGETE